MKTIAIVGFGNHVQKNILPAISRMKDLQVGVIVVRDPDKYSAENYIFTAPPLTISLNLMDISMAKINDVMQNNYMHFRY